MRPPPPTNHNQEQMDLDQANSETHNNSEITSHLIDVVQIASFLWPVSMTLGHTVLSGPGQHHNYHTALFPDHLPKVSHGVRQRALCRDVRRVTGGRGQSARLYVKISNILLFLSFP